MTTPILETKVHDFLAEKRIAVAGVSRNHSAHPVGNLIFQRLKTTGHDVFPVNPHMQTFEGERCYPDLKSIPGGVDGVVIITRPEVTERIVHDCGDAKVRRVWMHQSVGKGSSVSPEAVEYCRQHDIDVIAGGCPMMFGPGADLGHMCLRWYLKLTGGLHAKEAAMKRLQRVAWILILIVDLGFVAWGAMAAALPDYLLGPGGTPILTAGYEGFSRGSWSELARTTPTTAEYITVLFRMYGVYGVAFGLMASAIAVTAFRRGDGWAWWALLVGNTIVSVSAMTYDWTVNAIGPFELSEYLGLALVWGALAVTAPFRAAGRPVQAAG